MASQPRWIRRRSTLTRTMDIEHIVVLMLENSSFDRMLGSVPGVDGVDPSPIYDGSLGAWSAGRADGGGQVVCFVMEGFRGDADGCPAKDSRADDAAESRGG